jgi:hypothetical protein
MIRNYGPAIGELAEISGALHERLHYLRTSLIGSTRAELK